MRIKHVLWRVGNGWLRTPDDFPHLPSEKNNIFIFQNLRQFSDWCAREDKEEKEKLTPKSIKPMKTKSHPQIKAA